MGDGHLGTGGWQGGHRQGGWAHGGEDVLPCASSSLGGTEQGGGMMSRNVVPGRPKGRAMCS